MKHYEQRFRDFVGVNPITRALGLVLAGMWRRLMFRTTFIVISGSVGKTTAKDAIALVLGAHFPTYKTTGSFNHYIGITRNLLAVRPWHRYAVIEVGIERPGEMKWFALTTRPDIAVWVNVARNHMQSFRTLETLAKEKSLLVEGLRPGGIAILNSDNPYIDAYQPPSAVKTIRYGSGDGMDWRASAASSMWPDRLSFLVQGGGKEGWVSTRMIGTHWLPSILPALAVAHEVGIGFEQTCAELARLEPMEQRLSPAETPRGATFLRDEWNGSESTLEVAIEVMRQAVAKRKMIVVSDVSNSKLKERRRQRGFGQMAAEAADSAVFVGDAHLHAVKGAIDGGMAPDQVWGFYDLETAAEHLYSELREGDLVLLRGRTYDHMSRLYLRMLGEVQCWLPSCKKKISCDVCPELKSKENP